MKYNLFIFKFTRVIKIVSDLNLKLIVSNSIFIFPLQAKLFLLVNFIGMPKLSSRVSSNEGNRDAINRKRTHKALGGIWIVDVYEWLLRHFSVDKPLLRFPFRNLCKLKFSENGIKRLIDDDSWTNFVALKRDCDSKSFLPSSGNLKLLHSSSARCLWKIFPIKWKRFWSQLDRKVSGCRLAGFSQFKTPHNFTQKVNGKSREFWYSWKGK